MLLVHLTLVKLAILLFARDIDACKTCGDWGPWSACKLNPNRRCRGVGMSGLKTRNRKCEREGGSKTETEEKECEKDCFGGIFLDALASLAFKLSQVSISE